MISDWNKVIIIIIIVVVVVIIIIILYFTICFDFICPRVEL